MSVFVIVSYVYRTIHQVDILFVVLVSYNFPVGLLHYCTVCSLEIGEGVIRPSAHPSHTAWLKSLTMFSGALHLLHHYKSNLAHLLAF